MGLAWVLPGRLAGQGVGLKGRRGLLQGRLGTKLGVLIMTTFARIIAFVRSLAADQAGMSSMNFAVAVGLSSSAMLILVRVGAVAATMAQ